MIYPAVIYLMDLAAGWSRELFFATLVSCGLITFYSMPDAIPFLVRLTMMVATQFAEGRALRRWVDRTTNNETPSNSSLFFCENIEEVPHRSLV